MLISTDPGSIFSKMFEDPASLTQQQRTEALVESEELEAAYAKAATIGQSTAPEDPTGEVDFHFIAFVKTPEGHILELDGDRKFPIDHGQKLKPEDDILAEGGLEFIRRYISHGNGVHLGFSLMALVHESSS
jgi:ubiquitin carboxyl-terminal hydrolase L3